MAFWDRLLGRKDSEIRKFLSVSKLGKPAWTPREYGRFAKEGYSENVVTFACIRFIAEAIAGMQIVAKVNDVEAKDHPFLAILKRPNPGQSQQAFIDAVVSYYLIAGNGYIEATLLRETVAELYTHRPDRMQIIPGANGWPAAFVYKANGMEKTITVDRMGINQQRMLHFKSFNPLDDFYGQSAIEPAGYAIDTHNSSSGFNKALLDNAGSPSGAFEYSDGDGDMLPDKQFSRLQKSIHDKVAGVSNAGKILILEGGMKWIPMGATPKDLEYIEGKAASAREICLGFGVPPQLLGIPGDNTYSNYAEANRALYRGKAIPLANRILGEIAEFVAVSFPGLELCVNEDEISALAGERKERWERVKGSDFMTVGEKREAMGLPPYKPNEKDPTSYILVNGGMTSIDDALEPLDTSGGEEPKEPEDDDDDGEE